MRLASVFPSNRDFAPRMSRHTCTKCGSSAVGRNRSCATMRQIMMLLRRVGVCSYSPVLRNSCTRSTIGVTLAVGVPYVDCYDAIAKRILGLVDAGIFLRIAGEDDAEIRMRRDVGLVLILRREHQ